MSSVNKVILVGRLGQDPEVRTMGNGNQVVNLSVATSESWKDKSTGEKKEKSEWHKIVIFNEHLAKVASNYLKKGSQIYLEGALQTRKWEKDGVDRYSTEIVLQNFRGELKMLGRTDDGSNAPSNTGGGETEPDEDLNDNIPFAHPYGII